MVTTQLLPDKIAHTMGGKILLLLALVTFSECYVAIIDCTGKEGKVLYLLEREEVENNLDLLLGDNSRAVEVLRRRCVGMSFLFPFERKIAFGQLMGEFQANQLHNACS